LRVSERNQKETDRRFFAALSFQENYAQAAVMHFVSEGNEGSRI
jgi:hypothetical protein